MKDAPAVFEGTMTGYRTLADGTIRFQVDISPANQAGLFPAFQETHTRCAIARLLNDAGEAVGDEDYGKQASILWRSDFFSQVQVAKEIGEDAEYRDWLHSQKCALCHAEPPCEAAHVRRVGRGAGVAIKPPYSALPLCRACHGMQHTYGEPDRCDFEEKSLAYLKRWGWEKLKHDWQFETWKQINPFLLISWARKRDLEALLPGAYNESE